MNLRFQAKLFDKLAAIHGSDATVHLRQLSNSFVTEIRVKDKEHREFLYQVPDAIAIHDHATQDDIIDAMLLVNKETAK